MKRLLLSVTLLLGLALCAFAAIRLWPELREPPPVPGPAFETSPERIEAGRYLVRAGNCLACHTAAGEPEYAGGRRITTPFGDVYSSNLTPDRRTGLGAWTADEFWRALHHGRSKDGRRLSPAFPYTNYTLVSRADSDAMFAYLQSLPAIDKPRVAPRLRFPYNTQAALIVWRALFFTPGTYMPVVTRDAQWNRGAYLVEGLGHCNACHTERNALGAIRLRSNYSGGPIPTLGWDALPLNADLPTDDIEAAELAQLLHAGTAGTRVTSGPMAEVVFHSLQHLRRDDIDAMVIYLRTLPPSTAPSSRPVVRVGDVERKRLQSLGAMVYAQHCQECHGEHGEGQAGRYPSLAGNRLLTSASTTNAIRTVLMGGYGPSTAEHPRPYGMPPYAQRLSADEIAAVLTYTRNSWGNAAPAVSAVEIERRR